ncbi:hypothetical protein M2165_000275 [Variovorax sp. TBS-050B]|uniref:hypothetical protein n=1 Tax=Variovorax sp. TBS-050B TaxID=2940551 RepID=UPI0024733B7E|nr:hypothetical protein [Variovorax sp. TBS-050B]MDH6590386.1 hypothetical protein [Variovorax sp. TBS-050B]
MQQTVWTGLLVLNALWFALGARFFCVDAAGAARLLLPRAERASPLLFAVAGAVRFLGAMNLAWLVFCLLLLAGQGLFAAPAQWACLAAVLALVHAGQFAVNAHMALRHRRGRADSWAVLRGPMRLIFFVDLALAVANAAFAASVLAAA